MSGSDGDDRRERAHDGGGAGPPAPGDVDPVTLEVVRNACEAVAGEMNATLVRTSYSPNIKERKDCSCALFGPGGEMLSQAENIPVHLGAMPFSVAAAVERFDAFEPGDAVLLNDPFAGGAHLPDLTLVSPVFQRDDLVAFVANRAHHADVGGAVGGSVGATSTEIFQEGLRIPPVKLYEGGEPDEAVFDLLLANVRTPDERRGDLRAQQAANETGRRRFRELVAERGRGELSAALDALKDYAERRMRAEIRALPDGEYGFRDVLDDDGRGNEDLPVQVAVTVDGGDLHVDFAGTADGTEGPVNAPFAVTASATYYAVRAVTDPEIPANAGCYRPVEISTPAGSIVDAEPPAAVVGGNLETSQRVVDVLLGAFAEAVPERAAAAGQGTMNNVTFGGADPRASPGGDGSAALTGDDDPDASIGGDDSESSVGGQPYTFYETQAGGFGGRASLDGMDAVHVHMSNTLNTPAEVLETAYPLRVERYALRPDSGGAGEFRGGLGLRRDVGVRDHRATFSLLADRHRNAPYGLAGGGDGEPGAAFVGEGEDAERLPPKGTRELPAGALVSVRTPGGGGYGDPAERDPDAVRRDVRLGKVTPGRARGVYGVDVDGDAGREG